MRLDLDIPQEVFYALARKALEMRGAGASSIEPEDVACAVLGTWTVAVAERWDWHPGRRDGVRLSRALAHADLLDADDRPYTHPTHSARPRRLYPDGVEGVDLDGLDPRDDRPYFDGDPR